MTTAASKTSLPAQAKPSSDARRIWIVVGVSALIVAAIVFGLVKWLGGETMPRLNENAVVLTKFLHSAKFDQLPYDQQRQFYKVLDDRESELDEAFNAKRLTDSEYRDGIEAAWLGKHINHVEKYFALPPGQARSIYIAKLLDKKDRKQLKPGAKEPKDIKPDETAAELKTEKWPTAQRTQWEQFHKAYHDAKQAHDKAGPAATKPAKKKK